MGVRTKSMGKAMEAQPSELPEGLGWRIRCSLAAVAVGTVFTLWCLADTTALSMTLFFTFGVPLYGLGAALYIWEILLDLRRHEVL